MRLAQAFPGADVGKNRLQLQPAVVLPRDQFSGDDHALDRLNPQMQAPGSRKSPPPFPPDGEPLAFSHPCPQKMHDPGQCQVRSEPDSSFQPQQMGLWAPSPLLWPTKCQLSTEEGASPGERRHVCQAKGLSYRNSWGSSHGGEKRHSERAVTWPRSHSRSASEPGLEHGAGALSFAQSCCRHLGRR